MKTCLECGKEHRGRDYRSTFCAGTCRRVFNNRRATRGAALYDLTMIAEYSSEAAVQAVALERTKKLLAHWKKEDGARRRWKPTRVTFEDLSYLMGEKVGS